MKKSLISLGLLTALAFSVNAQDATTTTTTTTTGTTAPSGSEFKPSAGNITVEVLASSPFAGDGDVFKLSGSETGMPSLRFRYFLSEKMAFRLNFAIDAAKYKQDLGSKTETSGSQLGSNTNSTASGNTTPDAYKLSSNRFMVAIAPGLEFHKGVSERLSVYYGAYIDFAMQSAKGKITATPGSSSSSGISNGNAGSSSTSSIAGEYSYEIKGQNLGQLSDLSSPATGAFSTTNDGDITSPSFGNNRSITDLRRNAARSFTRIGLMGVLGADYYITKGLYLGLEVSWGYANTSFKKVTTEEKVTNINNVTINSNGGPAAPMADIISGSSKVEENKDSSWNIAPAVNAAFRFGFWF